MRAVRSLTLLFALAGASTAHAEEPKERPMSAEHAEKLLAFYRDLVDTVVKHSPDCPAVATEVDGLITRSINTVNMMWANKKLKHSVPADVQKQLNQRGVELVGALRPCWNDARVKAAFKRMQLPKEQPAPRRAAKPAEKPPAEKPAGQDAQK